ncbi:DUF294 nucleotidyltransferase-like domain-containing protein [Vibrio viridaestus]|uniref:Cyclic nucleotide-binding/CBS domain-containing protein n=1 Tax=Vibrio viridaestus TaxID=2487322 RepID=A0A3N9TC03_9VIBR|nr:DUF294 nucleotidyltransferase-like domain-containing protein [Vibrio viridaestus]RQW61681.1 cyclic nucleotide-binding/CBS domain-containing protein [Vibrio viridaestus]
MPDKFNMQSPPFDRLSDEEQKTLRSSLDVAYYRSQQKLLNANESSTHLFLLIKGVVEERSEDKKEVFAHYTNDDLFDVRAMFDLHSKHDYIALEDTLTYLLPKTIFLSLYKKNGEFAAYFDNNLANRQVLLDAAHQQQNLAEFILTKVDDSIYYPPTILDPDCTLTQATLMMKEHNVDAALVRLKENEPQYYPSYGIITRTDMLHALVINQMTQDESVSHIATAPVQSIEKGDFLFNALITMLRSKVKRLMVTQANNAVGLLDMTQVLSSFSTHSHVLTLSIARSSSIEELIIASHQQQQLVRNLIKNGIRTRFMVELIATVNEQIIEKAFELVFPPEIQEQCCLMVLGSEGRGEQILKTDQDNALIIDENLTWDTLRPIVEKFTHTLLQLGYPPCPGNIMVSNREWVKTNAGWVNSVTQWVKKPSGENMMKLAILTDAAPIAGNESMFSAVKQALITLTKGKEALLSEFTRPALNFSLPLTLFGNVKSSKEGIDIKQGGIFPIVHGVRALSLDYGIQATNTFDRLNTLVELHVLEQETADNLSEALKLFIKFRLAQQIDNPTQTNQIQIERMERMERDLLRHGLHVVKKFKEWLSYHYQIRD